MALTVTVWLHPGTDFTRQLAHLSYNKTDYLHKAICIQIVMDKLQQYFFRKCTLHFGWVFHAAIWWMQILRQHIMGFTTKPSRSCWNSEKGEKETHKTLIMPSISHLTQVSMKRAVLQYCTADKSLMHRSSSGDFNSGWLSKLAAKWIWQV